MQTLKNLQTALHNNALSSMELTQDTLKTIAEKNPIINAFITVTQDTALAQAKQADALLQSGQAGPLTGLPIAHKDIFCTQGILTTCASKMLANFTAPYDAHVVSQCQHAGMVMVGKTNMDEFAMGSSNESSYFGAVKNPCNLDKIPGGSSGGSAAAVAAGMVPAATGTDTGGSIRQPAALCGVTGLKPTYGLVSRYGMIAFASSLDQGGPMAHTAEDCALLLNAMAGFDERDSTCVDHPVPDYTAHLGDSIKGLKIGVPKAFMEALDNDMAVVMQAALTQYQKLGAHLVDIALPHNDLALPAYYVIAPAEASSNLSRYDGVRFGHRCDDPQDLLDLYCRSRAEGFGKEVQRRIMVGTYALSSGYYDAYYHKAQQIRRLIAQEFIKAFEQVDVIAGPTTPSPAFDFGAHDQDPAQMYLADIYTLTVNLSGLPGMSLPAGTVDGLPVGLQLIGQAFDEARLLNVAHQYQQATKE